MPGALALPSMPRPYLPARRAAANVPPPHIIDGPPAVSGVGVTVMRRPSSSTDSPASNRRQGQRRRQVAVLRAVVLTQHGGQAAMILGPRAHLGHSGVQLYLRRTP